MADEAPKSGTLDLLKSLGFQDTPHPLDLEAVSYDFQELTLKAVAFPVGPYFRPCVQLQGTYNDGRTLASLDTNIPFDLTDINEVKALLYFTVGRYVINAPPQWLTEGKDLQHTLRI